MSNSRALFTLLPAPGMCFSTSSWPLTSGRQRELPSLASCIHLNLHLLYFCQSPSSTLTIVPLHLLILRLDRIHLFLKIWRQQQHNAVFFCVHQELSLNKLWHDWMIWSASMVRPNPHLSVTWSCIMHEGSSQGLTDSSQQTWNSEQPLNGVGQTLLFPLSSPSLFFL